MSTPAPQTELTSKLQLFHESLGGAKLVRDDSQAEQVVAAVSELIEAVENKEIAVDGDVDLVGVINRRIAALDQEVNEELNKVMHNEHFCKLEQSWRGL